MKIIKKLCEQINEELDDAQKYIECALSKKEEYPQLSKAYNQLSFDEMDHVNKLHEQVVAFIKDYRAEHGEPPEAMKAVYDILHSQHLDKAKGVRLLQNMYKDGM